MTSPFPRLVCPRTVVHHACVLMLGAFLVAYPAQAQDSLRFFKHYFVTGDYTVGGVGLRPPRHR